MATIFTDTFTGADGSAWSATNWTVYKHSTQTVDINANRGRIFATSTAASTYAAAAVDNYGARGDQEILVTVTTPTNAFSDAFIGVKTVATSFGIANMSSGVYLSLRSGTASTFNYRSGSATTSLGTVPLALTNSTAYTVRLQVLGTTASYKIWAAGSAEPSSWTGTATVPTLPNGVTYLGRQYNGSSGGPAWYFDDVTVTDAVGTLSVTVDVPTATASATSVELPVLVDVPTATVTAEPYDVTVETLSFVSTNVPITADYKWTAQFGESAGNVATLTESWASPSFAIFRTAALSAQRARFKFTVSVASGSDTVSVAPLLHSSDNSVRGTAQTAMLTGASSPEFYFNTEGSTIYGFAVQFAGAGNKTITFTESATNKPVVTALNVPVITNIAVDVDTPLVSLTTNEAVVSLNKVTDVDTPAVSATAIDPTVEVLVNPNATVDLDTATWLLDAHNADAVVSATVDLSETVTAALQAHEVTVEQTTSALVDLDTPTVSVVNYKPAEVNGEPVDATEDEDPYFVSTMRTLTGIRKGFSGGLPSDVSDQPLDLTAAQWYRLNLRTGNVEYDRAEFDLTTTDRSRVVYAGVTKGLNEGPEGRHSVSFNGSGYIAQAETNPQGQYIGEDYYPPNSLEFTFRTEKATQFLMGGADTHYMASGVTAGWELWMVDGKLEMRYVANPGVVIGATRAFTNLADGEWHHVVIQNAPAVTFGGVPNYGMEIWVDSRLEIRRREYASPGGFPDYIGGRSDNFYNTFQSMIQTTALSQSQWYVGDLTEVIYRNGRVLSMDEITLQRDNMFGIVPVRPDSARIFTEAHDATAKGNKIRVLVLDFGRDAVVSFRRHNRPLASEYGDTISATDGAQAFEFIGLGEDISGSPINSVDLHGYQFFRTNVLSNSKGQPYRDIVTDNMRIVDLDLDLNMDDYDVITIADFPQTETQWSAYLQMDYENVAPFVPGRQQVEQLVAQIRGQVVAGKRLFISDPGAAVAFGIVDRVEWVPNFREMVFWNSNIGAATGLYDFRSAVLDPWRNAEHRKVNLDPDRYLDTHANVRQRVRTLVPGLTDIPSWIRSEYISWNNVDPLGNPPSQESYRYDDRTTGLNIGDEFFMEGSGVSLLDYIHGGSFGAGNRGARIGGWVASPIANVRAGKVVTSFGPKLHMRDDEIENPYKDFAISIAIEPGDNWNGQTEQGKDYVNFTEAWTEWAGFVETADIQVMPPNDQLPARLRESAEQRYYNFSTNRGTWNSSTIGGNQGSGGVAVQITPGGEISVSGGIAAKAGAKKVTDLVTFSWNSNFPMVQVPVVNMATRGLRWLTTDVDLDGNATVGLETAEASVKANEATVTAGQSVEINLSTARAQAEVITPQGVIEPDASVLVTTPGVTVKAEPFAEIVELDTATITATAYDDEESLLDEADIVTLVLPLHSLTLYMEDA